jgi:hypothetical protein
MAVCDPATLMQRAACLDCLTVKQLQQVKTYLLCTLVNLGTGSSTTCLLCGTADPVAAPACPCALYMRTDTSEMWFWSVGTATWNKVIST